VAGRFVAEDGCLLPDDPHAASPKAAASSAATPIRTIWALPL
jgi:hypothetical protein